MTTSAPDALDFGVLAELEEDLGPAFGDFVTRFLRTAADELDALERALDAGDLQSAAARAHGLKGTAGYLGAAGLVSALGALQAAAQGGDRSRAREHAAKSRVSLELVSPLLTRRARAP